MQLWANFSLSGKEDMIIDMGEGTSTNQKFAVVGALLSVQRYNHGALGRIMEKVWCLQKGKGMEFKKMGENYILFEFGHRKDYIRVLEGRPWSFDKNLLLIQEYDGL